MADNQQKTELLQLFADHEEALGELYRAYAEKLPGHRDFWLELAEEESGHSRWIRELGAEVAAGSGSLERGRFSVEAVRASLSHLREQLAAAQSEDVSLVHALSIGVDIEAGLIEKRFFEVLDSDAPDVKRVLRALSSATAAHRDRLRQAWEEQRRAE